MDKIETNERKWNINSYTQFLLLGIALIFGIMIGVSQNPVYLLGWAVFMAAAYFYSKRADYWYKETIKSYDEAIDQLKRKE